MTSPADADANLKRALQQLGQNEAAVAEAINEARAEHSRTEPPVTGPELLERIDVLAGAAHARQSGRRDSCAIGLMRPRSARPGLRSSILSQNVPSPMLVLDAYLVGAPAISEQGPA